MVKIYTSSLKYNGEDRMDITIGNNTNPAFSPTWELVMLHKKKKITNEEYTNHYNKLMGVSYNHHRKEWNNVLSMDTVTFVCYCGKGNFCHRVLLAKLFEKLGGIYMGER